MEHGDGDGAGGSLDTETGIRTEAGRSVDIEIGRWVGTGGFLDTETGI